MKKEVDLTMDLLSKFYPDTPRINDDFILFRNIKRANDKFNKYIIKGGIFISIVYEGKISLMINFEKYNIEAPAIVSIFPDYIMESDYYARDTVADSLFVSAGFINRSFFSSNWSLLAYMRFNPVLKIDKTLLNDLYIQEEVLAKLQKISDSSLRQTTMKAFFCNFFNQITQHCSESGAVVEFDKDNKKRKITCEFFYLLNHTTPLERGVAYYAGRLHITPKYLSSAVKSITGVSSIQWIKNAIMLNAKKMLSSTKLSVEQISEQLNYKSSSFFIYDFKEKTGVTPMQFRKSCTG